MKLSSLLALIFGSVALVAAQPPEPIAPLNKSFMADPLEPLESPKSPWKVRIVGSYEKTNGAWLKGCVTATIKDSTGAVVYAKTSFTNTTNGTWNLSSAIAQLPVGTYQLRVVDEASGTDIHFTTLYIQP